MINDHDLNEPEAQPYEPPALEDLDTSDGPAVTAAGGTPITTTTTIKTPG